MVRPADLRELERLDAELDLLDAEEQRTWMKNTYARYLYGGWERPQDGKIMGPYRRVIGFHEAAKALFCPKETSPGNQCWEYVGSMGTDIHATFKCPKCGHGSSAFGRGAAQRYKTLFLSGGNRSWKTLAGISELCSWIKGYRPWDGSLTRPHHMDAPFFFICGQTFSKSFPLTIEPYVKQCIGDMIVSENRVNKTINHWVFDNGCQLHALSNDQYMRGPKQGGASNSFEGTRFVGGQWDEAMHPGARTSVVRGLEHGARQGLGREIISATPLYSPYLFSIYQSSYLRGGSRRGIWVDEFTAHENPFMTESEVRDLLAEFPKEELDAREWGHFLNLAGRVYDMFDDTLHVVLDEGFDPLLSPTCLPDDDSVGERVPSDWPVIQVIDPHDSRPWAMGWYAIGPDEDKYVVAEWPEDDWETMRSGSRLSYDDYCAITARVEAGFPGNPARIRSKDGRWERQGPERVIGRIMDPNFGNTGNTASAGRTVADSMRDRGYYYETTVNDRLTDGHNAVADAFSWDMDRDLSPMNRPHLWMLPHCRNHRWSVNSYLHTETKDWDTHERQTPKGPAKDFCDLLRYLCMSPVYYRSWQVGTDAFDSYNRNLGREQRQSMGY
jgi:hypothetical protein